MVFAYWPILLLLILLHQCLASPIDIPKVTAFERESKDCVLR